MIKPVYYSSYAEATKDNKLELFRQSRQEDKSCKDFVKKRMEEMISSNELDDLIFDLVNNYGSERALYLLARQVQNSDWDKRYSFVVREHAAQIPEYPSVNINDFDPCILNIHPLKLNELYEKLIEREKVIEEFTYTDENEDEQEIEP